MKDSYFRTPRTLNECHWTSGYQTARHESRGEKVGGVLLAIGMGVALAFLLFYALSS